MNPIQRTGMALVLCLAYTCAVAQTENNFTINGIFTDTAGIPKKIYLYVNQNKVDEMIYSSDVINGRYHIAGHIDVATEAHLMDVRKESLGGGLTIIVDKGEINIESGGNVFRQGNKPQYKMTGSASLASTVFQEISRPVAAFGDTIKKMQADPAYRDDQTKLVKFFYENYGGVLEHALTLLYSGSVDYVRTQPESPAAPYFLAQAFVSILPKMSTGAFDSLMAMLPAAGQEETKKIIAHGFMQKQAMEKAKSMKESKTAIGARAPDFTQSDVNGNAVSLSSLKGKWVLVDFWASWCGPCRAENPNVVDAYNTYKDKGFTVLGVSLDDESTKAAWLAAIKKDGLLWTELSDFGGWQNNAAKLYNVKSIPQNFLIDPSGVIIATNLRGEALKKELASILK